MSKSRFVSALVAAFLILGPAAAGLAQSDDNRRMRNTLTDGTPASKLRPVKRKKRLAVDQRRWPSIEIDTVGRRGKAQTELRSRKLLLREIRLLERVLRNMRN